MMDDPNKTLPPRRPDRGQFDPAADRTMPGARDRKPDGRFEPGDLIMGRYTVLSELGQGGMGVVYKCFDETAGIEVALKALPPELSHNTLEMEDIRDNFQLVAKLVHQHIAISKNLERDSSNGNYYLIMECVEGEDLRRWIKRKRKENALTLETVLPVVRQVAEALDYAHEQKIIHRDIKPGNIMIDSAGHVKVLDFGLAAQIHTSMTRVSMAYHGTSGTGPYMAPEQWRGRAQGAAADQYALAVMTYEMLAGHLPFESTDAAVLKQAVLDEQPEPIANVSRNVQTTISRAMSKDPAERFGNCLDFVSTLSSKKIGTKKKTEKALWFTLAAIILMAGLAGGYVYYRQVENRRLADEKHVAEKTVRRQTGAKHPAEEAEQKRRESDADLEIEFATLKVKVQKAINRADGMDFDRGQTFGEKLDRMHENFKAADYAAMKTVKIDLLKKAQNAANWLMTNDRPRKDARALLGRVLTAKRDADKFNAADFVPPEYGAAAASEKKAKTAYESGEFQVAIKEFEASLAGYRRVREKARKLTLASLIRDAEQAKNQKDWNKVESCAEKIRTIDPDIAASLSKQAKEGIRQQRVANLLKEAEKADAGENWEHLRQICAEVLQLEPASERGRNLQKKAQLHLQRIAKENRLRHLKQSAAELQKQGNWQELKICAGEISDMGDADGKKLLAVAEAGLKKLAHEKFRRRIEQDRKRGFIYSKDGTKLYKVPYGLSGHYDIPNGVKIIGNGAFQFKDKLTGVTIPESVTHIEDDAFSGCNSLRSIAFPAKLRKIGKSAFHSCKSVSELIIRGEMLEIGENAFEKCKKLKKVFIRGTVKSFEKDVFYNCESLDEIVVEGRVDNIAKETFNYVKGLRKFTVSGEVKKIDESAFSSCDNLEEILISGKIENIGDSAFSGLKSLKNVTISGEVKSIGNYAFKHWDRKHTLYVSLPRSVTEINPNAFDLSTTRLTFAEGSRFYQDRHGALIDREKRLLVGFPTEYVGSYVVPQGIETIGSFAFNYCKKLTHVTIPKSVTVIGGWAFDLDTTRLTFAEGSSFYQDRHGALIDRSRHVFADLPRKYSGHYVIPDGIKSIGPHAFHFCTKLTGVTIPESVTSIGEYAFGWCADNLKEITIPSKVTHIGNSAFACCARIRTIALPSGLTRIAPDLFLGCRRLKTVIIPESVNEIAPSAFSSCESLRDIKIPAGVRKIGESAFFGCKSLRSIVLPDGLESIEPSLFSLCEKLESVNIPKSVTRIGESAFFGCKSLENIVLPEGLTEIAPSAFSSCESLRDIKIPAGVRKIGESAFSSCKSLRSIVLPDGLQSIEPNLLSWCEKLESVNIPESVTRIGKDAFSYCKRLRDISVPENVTELGKHAFWNCEALRKVSIGHKVKEIGESAFSGCISLRDISLPPGIESIGSSAFYKAPCESEVKKRFGKIYQ